jgi:hypothetical protein
MNWIKKFAQWVISEELAEERKHYQKINDDLRADKEVLEKSNEGLRRLAFGRRKHLVSQLMLECIVKCLPDPNAVGVGGITASDIKLRNMGFVDEIGGRKYDHKCFVKEITEQNVERGAIVHITDYNMNIFIPLRIENVSYEVYGVQTAIETYFWDFYGAGLRMLSAEAWAMATEFIRAQNNVMKEFREQGLL